MKPQRYITKCIRDKYHEHGYGYYVLITDSLGICPAATVYLERDSDLPRSEQWKVGWPERVGWGGGWEFECHDTGHKTKKESLWWLRRDGANLGNAHSFPQQSINDVIRSITQ